jgi:hypothetical protein
MTLIRCDECKNEVGDGSYLIRCERNGFISYGDWTELHFCCDGCAADWFERSHLSAMSRRLAIQRESA